MMNRVANRRLWLTEDGTVVEEGHADARTLLAAGAGEEIDPAYFAELEIPAKYLVGEKAAEKAANKAGATAANKAASLEPPAPQVTSTTGEVVNPNLTTEPAVTTAPAVATEPAAKPPRTAAKRTAGRKPPAAEKAPARRRAGRAKS